MNFLTPWTQGTVVTHYLMFSAGRKDIEYRDDTPFYRSRFLTKDGKFRNYKTLIMQVGYHSNARHLKFKIGEESYDREWEIIPIPPYEIVENKLSLEPYEYFGEISKILGYKTSQIILYYNADILMRVKIFYKGDLTEELARELESLPVSIPNNINLFIKYQEATELTLLLYQNKILIQNST